MAEIAKDLVVQRPELVVPEHKEQLLKAVVEKFERIHTLCQLLTNSDKDVLARISRPFGRPSLAIGGWLVTVGSI